MNTINIVNLIVLPAIVYIVNAISTFNTVCCSIYFNVNIIIKFMMKFNTTIIMAIMFFLFIIGLTDRQDLNICFSINLKTFFRFTRNIFIVYFKDKTGMNIVFTVI